MEKERKQAKKCALAASIVYLTLFPFLCMLAIASIMVFDSPSMSMFLGLSTIIIYFSLPVSIPFALYLIWSRYVMSNYKKSRQFCFIPLYPAIGICISGLL